MRKIEVKAFSKGRRAEDVFPIISDFERYMKHSDVVRSVKILENGGQSSVSDWEVNFRQGILKWRERDLFNMKEFTIDFEQLEGDAEHFSGRWSLHDADGGCEIEFAAQFDMGIPSLKDIIEPIAEQALQENIQAILIGLLDHEVEFIKRE